MFKCGLLSYENEQTGQCEWHWPTLLLIWTIANCGPGWLTVAAVKKYKPDRVRDKKFEAFWCFNAEELNYTMATFTHFFMLPRLFFAWTGIFLTYVGCLIGTIGLKADEMPGPFRQSWLSWSLWIGSRASLLAQGVSWISVDKVPVDYKKWLGPSWKFDAHKSYEGAGIYVSNHQTFSDIFV